MSTPAFENGWEVPGHDYQEHTGATANHGPLSVVYKKGGAGGKIVAIETITYDVNNNIATRAIEWESDTYL